MNFFVSGASGFIGYHLIRSLLNQGHKVYGIDNHNNYYDVKLKLHRQNKLNHKNYFFKRMDLNDLLGESGHFDYAINLAAQAGVRIQRKDYKLYEHSNIRGFRSFWEFCLNNSVKKIIYASSSSIYSDISGLEFEESITELNPKSYYGRTKLFNEKYSESITKNSDLSVVGLRFFSVYGPLGRPDMAYYKFTSSILNNEIIHLHNNGLMARDMTYIDDIVSGILNAIDYVKNEANKGKHEVFNLGNDSPVATIDLLELIESKLGKKAKIKHVQTSNESSYTHANLSKSKKILGYNPQVNIEYGLEEFINWYRNYESV